MKLTELKLFEGPIATITAEEAWAAGESTMAQYISATLYFVRPVTTGDKSKFEVMFDENGRRKLYATMDKEDLDASFTPVRPNQTPDAEGFIQYRTADAYDAFKWTGDPVKVTIQNSIDGGRNFTVKVNRGDWLLRQDDGSNFVYTVERDSYFNNNFIRKT